MGGAREMAGKMNRGVDMNALPMKPGELLASHQRRREVADGGRNSCGSGDVVT